MSNQDNGIVPWCVNLIWPQNQMINASYFWRSKNTNSWGNSIERFWSKIGKLDRFINANILIQLLLKGTTYKNSELIFKNYV
jgi:hypothetical protein